MAQEESRKADLSVTLGTTITAVAAAGSYLYAGSADGQLFSSADGGVTWNSPADRQGAAVEAISVNEKDPLTAVAAIGTRMISAANLAKPVHVIKTMKRGNFWDDLTSNLPMLRLTALRLIS